MITAELIDKRIEELEAERTNAIARLQALTGALQDCEFWKAQLSEQETIPEEENKS
jgi:prefoldin subunit 5